MGMIDRAFAVIGYEKRSSDYPPSDPSWQALAPGIGAAGAISARKAENLSTVFACTTAIGSALASCRPWVYRREADGTRVEAHGHPLNRLVRGGVNGGMAWPEYIEHIVASALLTGNGLAEIERDGRGQLAGFTWIPWQHVTVTELRSGRLAYDTNNGLGRTRRLLAGEVLHLRDRTNDGLIGVSRLSRAGDAVAGVQSSNEFARKFLENGAQPSGVIRSDSVMTAEQRASLKEQFTARYQGTANAGKTLILDGGLDWKASSISPEDAELLESRKFGVVEICRIFQVPPPIVQAYENNTFTNAAQAGLWFATFCLAPWARRIEAEFARSVFPANGPYELELDLSSFLRGDPETRWNAHKIALDTGVLDTDEVRQVEGWNPRGADGGKPMMAEGAE